MDFSQYVERMRILQARPAAGVSKKSAELLKILLYLLPDCVKNVARRNR
jgi:hypothetical protein